jgi:hypothetical protein
MFEVISERECSIFSSLNGEYKLNNAGKAIPLQAWTGPQGSRRLRLPGFKTIGT